MGQDGADIIKQTHCSFLFTVVSYGQKHRIKELQSDNLKNPLFFFTFQQKRKVLQSSYSNIFNKLLLVMVFNILLMVIRMELRDSLGSFFSKVKARLAYLKENRFEELKVYERTHLFTTSGVMEKIQTISSIQL